MTLWSAVLGLVRQPRATVPATAAIDLTPDLSVSAVARAVACEGRGRYALGTGGRHPESADPFGTRRDYRATGAVWCDCSGFTSFALGLDRYQPGKIAGDWLGCNQMAADAVGPQRMFRTVAPADVRPGDLLVYPGRSVGGRRVAIGHVSVVVARPAFVRSLADVAVTHCHGGRGPAVSRATGALWERRGGIAVRRVAPTL